MTIGDIFHMFGEISDAEMEYALWSETAYPFADVKMLYYQIKHYMRVKKRKQQALDKTVAYFKDLSNEEFETLLEAQ